MIIARIKPKGCVQLRHRRGVNVNSPQRSVVNYTVNHVTSFAVVAILYRLQRAFVVVDTDSGCRRPPVYVLKSRYYPGAVLRWGHVALLATAGQKRSAAGKITYRGRAVLQLQPRASFPPQTQTDSMQHIWRVGERKLSVGLDDPRMCGCAPVTPAVHILLCYMML